MIRCLCHSLRPDISRSVRASVYSPSPESTAHEAEAHSTFLITSSVAGLTMVTSFAHTMAMRRAVSGVSPVRPVSGERASERGAVGSLMMLVVSDVAAFVVRRMCVSASTQNSKGMVGDARSEFSV